MCACSFRVVPSFVFNIVLFLGQLLSKVTYQSTILSVHVACCLEALNRKSMSMLRLMNIKWAKDEIIDIYSMKQ